jgi:hypothetical protein
MKITRLDPLSRKPTADAWSLSRACRRLTIGRAPPADVLLDNPDVSPLHAELSWQSGSLSIRDLASINGVFLRDSRILRAPLQDQDVFSVGQTPFLVSVEPADLAARRTHLLTFAGILLGALLLAFLILSIALDVRNAAPEAPPQDPVPLLPPVTDAALHRLSDQYAQASDLLVEARRILADGLDDLRAAQLLQQAYALNTNLVQASLLLKGLQDNRGPAIQRQIDRLVAQGQFQNALDLLQKQQALVGAPDAVDQTKAAIAQRIQYQNALQALRDGDLDQAQSLLDALPPDFGPERQSALDRLAKSRAAVQWADDLQHKVDALNLDDARALAAQEPTYAPFLSPDALGEVHGALARADAIQDVQRLVALGNAYVLVPKIADVPALSHLLQPLRDQLAPQVDALRQTATHEAAKTQPPPLPVTLDDALASYAAAQAYAALYVLQSAPADLAQYRRHADRWQGYLAAVASRANAYADQGAREEARAILSPLLPHLDEYDPLTFPLRNLAAHLAPTKSGTSTPWKTPIQETRQD